MLLEHGAARFEEIYRIYEESFPAIERRTREGQRKVFDNPYYRLRVMEEEPEKLASIKGITPKRARQIRSEDYERFDWIVGMDDWNMRNLRRAFPGDPEGKLHKLLDFCGDGSDVADPWYTGDFDVVWEDLLEGCQALLREYR